MSNTLIEQILALQETSRVLDPNENSRHTTNEQIVQYADNFFESLKKAPTYIQTGYDDESLSSTDFEKPNDVKEITALLCDHMDAPGINTAHGGHLGYIPGGGLYAAALGDYIAAITNKYAGVFYASPGAVRIENALLEWSAELIGYEKGYAGNITSGGSIANLIAVATARDAKNIAPKDFDRVVIYTTSQAHHCINKAIIIAGLRGCKVRHIPMDDYYRMDADALAQQIYTDKDAGLLPFMIIANAGSTDVGAIDPLLPLSKLAITNNIWLHVDAAYGGYFMLLNDYKSKFDGIQYADSVVMDPHKGMFLPYGTGIVLIKERKHLQDAFAYDANYMQDTKDFDATISPADVSPELSKHFRGMRMWLPLKLYGVQAFKDCLREKLLLTTYFAKKIIDLGFELVCQPELSVVAYRYVPQQGNANEFNKKLMAAIHADGQIFISSTSVDNKYVLRFACLSFRTHLSHVDKLLQMLDNHLKLLLQSN